MIIYVAGPMTGIPEFNIPMFNEVAAALRASGHEVRNPAELGENGTGKPWDFYLRRDLKMLVDCDAVALLPGWKNSRGARLETTVAQELGMPCRPYADFLE